jgi:hypothetical protein
MRRSRFSVDADLMSCDFSAENVNPSHKRDWRSGLEPGTNPKAFGLLLLYSVAERKIEIASRGFFFRFGCTGEYITCQSAWPNG